MAEEVWKDVQGYEGLYQVSSLCRVKTLEKKIRIWNGYRTQKERILCGILQHSGYVHIGLWRNRECKQSRLHRLVAAAFCPNDDPVNKTQVNHINENKQDNRACNLEWVTPKQNTNYGGAIARRLYGREKAVQCLSKSGEFIQRFISQAEANAFCGVSRKDGHIAACCNGKQKTAYGYRWQYA